MTTMSEAREAIYKHFVDNWALQPALLPVAYTFDNEDFDPPDNAPWVRLAVRHLTSGQETLGRTGNRQFERGGIVFVQIFVLADTGLSLADFHVASIRSLFEGVTLLGTGLWFTDCVVTETGPDGKWFGLTISASFSYRENK